MFRKFLLLLPLLTAVFLATPAFAPATTMGLSGSAQAQKLPATESTTINTTKSNTFRESPNKTTLPKKQGKTKQPATGGPAGRSSDPLKGLNVEKSKPVK